MAELPKVVRIGDTLTNLIDKNTNQTITYTKVNNWWDGTPMTADKADGEIYRRKGVEYFLKNLGKYGELFLEKDTMQEMRDLNSTEILLLQMGYYKGVKLNGYYAKGDTPAPIEYLLSTTSDDDDGGSVIQLDNVNLHHDFKGSIVHDSYFGFSETVTLSKEDNLTRLNAMYSSGANEVVHSKGVVAEVEDTVVVPKSDLYIIGNGFTIKQGDQSGMIATGVGHLKHLFHVLGDRVTVDGLVFDDNIENNYEIVTSGGITRNVHWSSPNIFPGATRVGHDVVVAEGDDFTIRNCTVIGASWTAIKVQRRQSDLTRIVNPTIENNTISLSARDAISALHVINPKIRGNKVYNSSHHAIHSYINNFNTLIEKNYVYNDVSEFFEWYTGLDFEILERSAIVLDHGNYPDKTKLTKVFNNVIEGRVLRDVKSGITSGGFPEDVEIDGNTTINCGNGIFISRGNPIGEEGSKVTNNNIVKCDIGIAYWLANGDSGWQGGFTTPQSSNNICANNKIEALDTALRVTGSQGAISEWYSKYHLLIENNTIIGNPSITFNQGINFLSNVDGKDFKIIYRKNTTIEKANIISAQTIVNTKRGDAEVDIEGYYPVKTLAYDLIVASMVPGNWYKLFTFNTSTSSILTGTIKLYDRRGTFFIADLGVYLRNNTVAQTNLRYISNFNTSTSITLTRNDIAIVTEEVGATKVFSLYIKTENTNRDIVIDYSNLYFNNTLFNNLIEFENDPVGVSSLPSGAGITVTNPTLLSYNPANYIEGASAPNGVTQDGSTEDTYPTVSEFNELVNKYNSLVTLTNELKTKVNQSLATEVAIGQRRGS